MEEKKSQVPANIPEVLVPDWQKLADQANKDGDVVIVNPTEEEQVRYDALFGVSGVKIVSDTNEVTETGEKKKTLVLKVQRESPEENGNPSVRVAARSQTFA